MDLMRILYIVLIVLLVVILIVLAKYNTLIRLQNRVKKSKANIDIYLNKRFELIPNIVETVKGYTKHESSTLEEIVALRNNYVNAKNLNIKEASEMNSKLNGFLAVIEAYPELKANTQFLSLQNELSRIENELENARRRYNDEVTRYNTAIETVPSNLVASMFSFKKASLFEVEEHVRQNVKISL